MTDKSRAYTWVAYMMTHQPEEMQHLLKYGTPSDKLIQLSNRNVEITVDKDDSRWMSFPISLNKSAGQKLLFKAAKDLAAFKKIIPLGAFITLQDIQDSVKLRRKDAQDNLLLVAEAILHRCATEFKAEVLFSFDSINAWIEAKVGKTLGYVTIRKAIELLESKFFLKVREWGQRGNRRRATKIYVNFDSSIWKASEHITACDEWVISSAHCMEAVYSRESTTRQDVLEVHIHRYSERILSEAVSVIAGGSAWPALPGLFPAVDATMDLAETSSAPMTLEEMLHELHINRFLGELVQPLQEDDTSSRENSSELSKHYATQSRSRSG